MSLKLWHKNLMTMKELELLLLEKYRKTHGGNCERTLIKKEGDECVFYELSGSPPKGYAIWIPENRWLLCFSATGKKFRQYSLVHGITDYPTVESI